MELAPVARGKSLHIISHNFTADNPLEDSFDRNISAPIAKKDPSGCSAFSTMALNKQEAGRGIKGLFRSCRTSNLKTPATKGSIPGRKLRAFLRGMSGP